MLLMLKILWQLEISAYIHCGSLGFVYCVAILLVSSVNIDRSSYVAIQVYSKDAVRNSSRSMAMRSQGKKHLMAAEMKFLWKTQRMAWTDRKTNESVFKETDKNC